MHYAVICRYIPDTNVLRSSYCKRISLLNVEFFINVFYLILFCFHICVDDVIEKIKKKKKKKSIHQFILEMQQRVPGPKKHTNFWLRPPMKLLKYVLAFLHFCQQAKVSLFYLFIIEIQPNLQSVTGVITPIFWPCPTKTFLINFFVINSYKSTKYLAALL